MSVASHKQIDSKRFQSPQRVKRQVQRFSLSNAVFDTNRRHGTGGRLGTNKENALQALLTCNSIEEAARKSRLSSKTIHRYLNEEQFKKEFRSARRELVEHSIAKLQKEMSNAVDTLARNQNCGLPSVEINAAKLILENGIKGAELLDLAERLESLEARMEDK